MSSTVLASPPPTTSTTTTNATYTNTLLHPGTETQPHMPSAVSDANGVNGVEDAHHNAPSTNGVNGHTNGYTNGYTNGNSEGVNLDEWFLGSVDQGTTSTRFIIFNNWADPVAMHQIEFENLYPHSGYVGAPSPSLSLSACA